MVEKSTRDFRRNFYKSKSFRPDELASLNYNFDQCGFPKEEEEILEPLELIQNYQQERAVLNKKLILFWRKF